MTGLIIKPAAGWVNHPAPDDEDERPTRAQEARFNRAARDRTLLELLGGVVYINTTFLYSPRDGHTLVARDRSGSPLRWSIWAPTPRVLIDRFERALPATEELEDRSQFVRQHGLRYAMVEPGRHLSFDALKEWLDGRIDRPD